MRLLFQLPARTAAAAGRPKREREDADTAAVAAIMVRAASASVRLSARLSSVSRPPLFAVASSVALCADDLLAADAADAVQVHAGGEGVGGKCDQGLPIYDGAGNVFLFP